MGRLAAIAILATPLWAGTGAITGRVVDADQKPVAGAYLFIFEQNTGVPLTRTKKRFTDALRGIDVKELWRVKTDANGAFSFDGVPTGIYRLVAQSWRGGAKKDGKPFEINGVRAPDATISSPTPFHSQLDAKISPKALSTSAGRANRQPVAACTPSTSPLDPTSKSPLGS